jgi:hypothetical protein
LPLFEQTLATAVPAYPVAQFQPITEKVLIARLVSVLLAPLYPVDDGEGAVQVERLQPLNPYGSPLFEHTSATAVSVYPVAHVQPVTAKVLITKLVSVLLAPLYPVVEVGVMHFGIEHTTPPLSEEAGEQTFPIEAVHGLSPVTEQVVILEVSPLMSIVD